ncbi:hypothetical protein GCM10009776_19150 [Microbacterium deminutum]|uniref:Uncharacterized protein n=1 Tax=Microbacterium deminutum TaxID=344164 RepID=A0ABN2QSN7_9MICO
MNDPLPDRAASSTTCDGPATANGGPSGPTGPTGPKPASPAAPDMATRYQWPTRRVTGAEVGYVSRVIVTFTCRWLLNGPA